MFSQGFTYKQLFSLFHTGSRWAKIEKKSSQRAVNDKGLSPSHRAPLAVFFPSPQLPYKTKRPLRRRE